MGETESTGTPRKHGKRLPLCLSRDEVGAMLKAPSGKSWTAARTRGILAALSGAGLRVSELCALSPGDIRWDLHQIEVHRGKGCKDRNVDITPETLAFLKAWDSIRPAGSRVFFTTYKGGGLSPRYIQQLVKNIARKANIPNAEKVHPHTLRHSFATLSLEDGLSIYQVSRQLGHSNVSTTSDYLHVFDKDLKEKVQARPPLVSGLVVNSAGPVEPEQDSGEVLAAWRKLPRHDRIYLQSAMMAELLTGDSER